MASSVFMGHRKLFLRGYLVQSFQQKLTKLDTVYLGYEVCIVKLMELSLTMAFKQGGV